MRRSALPRRLRQLALVPAPVRIGPHAPLTEEPPPCRRLRSVIPFVIERAAIRCHSARFAERAVDGKGWSMRPADTASDAENTDRSILQPVEADPSEGEMRAAAPGPHLVRTDLDAYGH